MFPVVWVMVSHPNVPLFICVFLKRRAKFSKTSSHLEGCPTSGEHLDQEKRKEYPSVVIITIPSAPRWRRGVGSLQSASHTHPWTKGFNRQYRYLDTEDRNVVRRDVD
jgi:hypothetical protein